MADDIEIPLAPQSVPAEADGVRRVYITGQQPEVELPLNGPANAAPPSKPDDTTVTKPIEGVNDFINLLGTGATNLPMDLVGLPGTASRVYEAQKKQDEQNPQPKKKGSITDYMGDEHAAEAARAAFAEFVGKHLPSGEDIKDWFWGPNGPGGAMGIPRREPDKNSIPQRAIVGAEQAMLTPYSGPKALAGLSSAIGTYAEQLAPEHPALANFITQALLLTGAGAAVKSARVAGEAAPKTAYEALGGTPDQRVARALIDQSGLTKPELERRLLNPTPLSGSKPTTAELVNTPGMNTAETYVKNNEATANAFVERSKDQNAARVAAAQTIAPTGDASAPGRYFQGANEAVEGQIAARQQAAANEIQARLQKLGPDLTPEKAGTVIRDVAERHFDEANTAVKNAFNGIIEPGRAEKVFIDPKPALTRINRLLGQRYGRMNPAPGELTAFRDSIADVLNDGTKLSYRDMHDLISRVQTLAGKYANDKNAQAVALGMRDILMQRMEASASEVAKLPEALQRFSKEKEAETIAQRLTRLNELRDIEGESAIRRWGRSRAELEDRIKQTELRMRKEFGTEGAMNPDEYERYLTARSMRAAMGDKFERGAVGDVLAKGKEVGNNQLTPSEVAGRFWHNDARSSAEDMKQFADVLGGDAQARDALRDYAVGNLRAIVDKNGGELTDKMLRKYLTDHANALNTPIGAPIKKELTDLQRAREAIASDIERRTNFLEDYQKSGARHFLGDRGKDPDVAIKAALSPRNKTGTQDMADLARLARTDPSGESIEGLKALIRDDFLSQTDRHGMLDAKKAKEWFANNAEKIAPVIGKDNVEVLRQIADDMGRITTSQSTKPQTLAATLNKTINGQFNLVRTLPLVKHAPLERLFNFLNGKQEETIDLFHQAMLDPALARLLITKVTPATAPGIINKLKAFLKSAGRNIGEGIRQDHGVARTIRGPLGAAAILPASRIEGRDAQ